MMNLASRQSHLKEMGISQWYARYSLSGAAASTIYSRQNYSRQETSKELVSDISMSDSISTNRGSPESTSQEQSVNPESIVVVSDRLGRVSINESPLASIPDIELSLDNTIHFEQELQTTSPKSAPDKSNNSDSISLRLYRLGDCLIISESEDDSSQRLELKLLQNILTVCDFMPSSVGQYRYEQGFNWPVFGSPGLQQNENGGYEQLLTKWFSEHIEEGLSALLYFGNSDKASLTLCDNLVRSKGITALVFYGFSHSLAELLKMPSRKSSVWRQLSCSDRLG